jgi:hypothetical protein
LTELASRLEPEARHYGKLLEGEAPLDAGKPRDALESFGAAQALTEAGWGASTSGSRTSGDRLVADAKKRMPP